MRATLLETKCETKEEEWLAEVDDFRTFLTDFALNVPQVGLAIELRL